MSKVAVVVLADTEGGDALGRIVNALYAVKEFAEAGDEVQLIFTGTGTKWIGVLEQPTHKLHAAYKAVKPRIAGACGFCAGAFEVTDAVQAAGVCLMEDYGANMSFRQLVNDGFQVITF
jgi:hypothetical protein